MRLAFRLIFSIFCCLSACATDPVGPVDHVKPAAVPLPLVARKPLPLPASPRASWVVRTTLKDRAAIQRIVEQAAVAGLNSLFVQVRGRGDAWFRGGVEPIAALHAANEFDPLEELLCFAHARGIAVHAWVNANLVADPEAMPADEGHVVRAHPEWLQLPEALCAELLGLAPKHPVFVERLVQHARANKGSVEGLFADPANPEYRAHVVNVVADLARRYPLEGIHLDYIRYPGRAWGYSTAGLAIFRNELQARMTAKEHAALDAAQQSDPLLAVRRYPQRFDQFRRDSVNSLVAEVSTKLRQLRPDLLLSAAVFPEPESCKEKQFQDWRVWLREGWIDVACPMNYAVDRQAFERALNAELAQDSGKIIVGLGSWRLPLAETLERMALVQRRNAGGVLLFSHGGLEEQAGAFEALGEAARKAVVQ
ncbi:MAG: hypothetical protein EXS14_00165 [Planctomycetes bacterium]|nr:hypothetical protein [Planctomycetota bacterium]